MIEFYKSYFERLSRLHKQLLHTDEERSFFYVRDKYNPKAFDIAVKSAAKTTVFLLERFTGDYTDNANKNYLRNLGGRFTIVASTDNGDQETIEEAEQLTERIALSFIRRMNRDFGNGGAIISLPDGTSQRILFNMSTVPVDPVGPLNLKYYGVTVGFNWMCPFTGADDTGDWLNNDPL